MADIPVQPLLLKFPAHNGPGQNFLGAKAGETFSAQVLGKGENGLTLLSFGGRQVPVNLPNPPPVGSVLTLQIKNTAQGMQLVLLDTRPADANQAAPRTAVPLQPGGQNSPGAAPGADPSHSKSAASQGARIAESALGPSRPAAQTGVAAAFAQLPPVAVQAAMAAMANQNSAAALFANLFKLGDKTRDLPKPVRHALEALSAQPIKAERPPSGPALAQKLLNSGILLEAKLAHKANQPPLSTAADPAGLKPGEDLKGLLLQLERSLRDWLGSAAPKSPQHQAPPPHRGTPPRASPLAGPMPDLGPEDKAQALRLLAQAGEALSRLRLLQIASLPDPGSPAHHGAVHKAEWHMELPILFGPQAGMVHFLLEREEGHGAGSSPHDPKHWRVRLALEAGTLGPVSADIRLGGGQLGITLWAERPEVAKYLSLRLEELRTEFEEGGLPPASIHIRRPTSAPAQSSEAGHFVDLGT